AFAEWHRVLRPGGSVVVVTSNRSNPLMAAARLLPQGVRTAVKGRGPGAEARDVFPVRYRANTPAALTDQLVRAGFQPVRVVPVATLHRYAGRRRAAAERLLGQPSSGGGAGRQVSFGAAACVAGQERQMAVRLIGGGGPSGVRASRRVAVAQYDNRRFRRGGMPRLARAPIVVGCDRLSRSRATTSVVASTTANRP